MADGPMTAETLLELVTRRDVLSFLAREPEGATSWQIARALRSVGLNADPSGVGVLLGHMRRDRLVTARAVALGGKRGIVTTWKLAPTSEPSKPRRLRMVVHAHRPGHTMHRRDCAHETECVAQVADLEPSAEACECPGRCEHFVEVPHHVRVALAAPRRSMWPDDGDEEARG